MLKNLFAKLGKTDLRKIIFVFPFIACLHELEEWNVLPWHRRYNTNVPSDVTNADLHIIFILISIMFFIWTFISLVPKNRKTTAYLFFPLITIGFVNGIEHLIWSIEFWVYAPGFVFGFIFEMPLIIYIAFRILKENLVAKWYSTLFGVLAVLGSVNLLLLGKELDPVIRGAMNFSKNIVRLDLEVMLMDPNLISRHVLCHAMDAAALQDTDMEPVKIVSKIFNGICHFHKKTKKILSKTKFLEKISA